MRKIQKNMCHILLLGLTYSISCRPKPESPFQTRNAADVFADASLRSLAEAAAQGNAELIAKVVNSGVAINGAGRENITPLYWAFRQRNEPGFSALLKMGANPNLYLGDGTSYMFEFAAPLADENYENDNTFFLEIALKYGGNPNLLNENTKASPLMAAVTLGSSTRRIDLLIEAGAEINYQTKGGKTALLYAATLNQYHIVWRLIEHGASFDLKTKYGGSLANMIQEDVYWPPSEALQKANLTHAEHYAARKRVIAFLRKKGYKFVAYEDNPENIKNAGKTLIKNYRIAE